MLDECYEQQVYVIYGPLVGRRFGDETLYYIQSDDEKVTKVDVYYLDQRVTAIELFSNKGSSTVLGDHGKPGRKGEIPTNGATISGMFGTFDPKLATISSIGFYLNGAGPVDQKRQVFGNQNLGQPFNKRFKGK